MVVMEAGPVSRFDVLRRKRAEILVLLAGWPSGSHQSRISNGHAAERDGGPFDQQEFLSIPTFLILRLAEVDAELSE